MSEYSYNNIIIDPEEKGVEKLIGKEVYAGDIPGYCLKHAKEGDSYYLGTLIEIRKYNTCPFLVKHDGQNEVFSCIIEKKEDQKPKYVPFETLDEFIESYKEVEERINYSNAEDYIASCGIWLKDKDRDVYCLVTELWGYGVVVGDSRMKTIKDGDGYFTFNEVTKWDELLRGYTFMDDSSCGKLAEEDQ